MLPPVLPDLDFVFSAWGFGGDLIIINFLGFWWNTLISTKFLVVSRCEIPSILRGFDFLCCMKVSSTTFLGTENHGREVIKDKYGQDFTCIDLRALPLEFWYTYASGSIFM